jgi:hypothetical protein
MVVIEHAIQWLKEMEEDSAAALLEECQLKSTYATTYFAISSSDDSEMDVYDVQVRVPGKYFKVLDEKYSKEKADIENAIKKSAESDGFYVQSLFWTVRTDNYKNISDQQKETEIVKYLNADYVRGQIKLMQSSIASTPHLAIGTAKELIETVCKSILNNKNVEIDKNWDIGRLVKETNKKLELIPAFVEEREKAKVAIEKLLGGFSMIVQGIAELRNSFGTGHGHEPQFKSLDEIYAKLVVASASEFAIFYLEINKRGSVSSCDTV